MNESTSSVSREEAREIAEAHLARDPHGGTTGRVREVLAWNEIDFRRPAVYGYDQAFWRHHWIVYLEQPGMALRSSMIVAVHRGSGEVAYVGSANDEG